MATVIGLFDPLKKFLLKPPKVVIDNFVFQLHYKVTCGLLLFFTILSGCTQYFGNPMSCYFRANKGKGGWAGTILSLYCWGKGTYTIQHKNTSFDFHVDLKPAHPGLGTFHPEVHDKVYHDYYQWVCFWTFFQLLCFYLTRMLWKKLEEGNIFFLVNGLKEMEEDDEKEEIRISSLIQSYKYRCSKPRANNIYANKFMVIEFLNFIHVILQIFLTDFFLNGQFLSFGRRFFGMTGPGQIGAFDKIFPKVTSCDFRVHGSGGDITTKDVICVLPLNIINEKIFLLLWLWLPTLAILSGLSVIYRCVVVFYPALRPTLIFKFTALGKTNKKYIEEICRNSGYEDWFILKLLMKNVHFDTFGRFLAKMAQEEWRVGDQRAGEVAFGDLGGGDVGYKYLGEEELKCGDFVEEMACENEDLDEREFGELNFDDSDMMDEEMGGEKLLEMNDEERREIDDLLLSGRRGSWELQTKEAPYQGDGEERRGSWELQTKEAPYKGDGEERRGSWKLHTREVPGQGDVEERRGSWKLHPIVDPYQGDVEAEGSELEEAKGKGNKINQGARRYSKNRSGCELGASSGSL